MLKNLFLLGLMTWVAVAYARQDYSVHHHSMTDAESYRVEKPVSEQEATRAVAGSKIKKKKQEMNSDAPSAVEPSESSDSEVRYWQYSE